MEYEIGKWKFVLNEKENEIYFSSVYRDNELKFRFRHSTLIDLDYLLDDCILKGLLTCRRG